MVTDQGYVNDMLLPTVYSGEIDQTKHLINTNSACSFQDKVIGDLVRYQLAFSLFRQQITSLSVTSIVFTCSTFVINHKASWLFSLGLHQSKELHRWYVTDLSVLANWYQSFYLLTLYMYIPNVPLNKKKVAITFCKTLGG